MWDLAADLAARREAGLYRAPRTLAARGTVAEADGRRFQVFCSNDYLGLADEPRVIAAFRKAAEDCGVGAGAAHLVTGHRAEHQALEEELADFLGRDRALLFSTGYMANLGAIDALIGRGDTVYQDRLNHASLLDGARLAGARLVRYPHADAAWLAERLAPTGRRQLVVTDGVFSMDGDLAPLTALAEAAARAGAWLMVDDAHGIGVLGERGAGALEVFGLGQKQVPVLVGTLGKAFGTFGAFVAGSEALIETLVQAARTFVYTTAAPPAVAAASRESLRIVRDEPWRRAHLRALIQRFRQGAGQLGLPVMPSETAIQPLLVGEATAALALSQALEAAGYLVTAIRPPTVPKGGARLRVTLSAAHTEAQVDGLLGALERLVPQWPR